MNMKEAVKVRELDPLIRVDGFDEVVLGYTEQQAQEEASRCLQCRNPVCISGCPVEIDIPKQVTLKQQRLLEDLRDDFE